jgi:tetratricopeptide (TPR) repeat protein
LKRTKTLLLLTAVSLLILVFILTSRGLNDNKQTLAPTSPLTPKASSNTSNPIHPTPSDLLFDWIQAHDDTTLGRETIDNALKINAEAKDFKALLKYCSSKDSLIADFCLANLALISEKWTEFDHHIKRFAQENMENKFVIQVSEPLLLKAIGKNPNPLNYNHLADVYLHDQSNMPRFMLGIRSLKNVLDMDSTDETALYKLGIFSVRSNQLEKAKQRFKKLISLHPENEGYRKILEELCLETKDLNCFPAQN